MGGGSRLSAYLVPYLRSLGCQIVTCGRSELNSISVRDVTEETIARVLRQVDPDVIVNLIACTDVNFCEQNPKVAYALNAGLVASVGAKKTAKAQLVHISTDQIYSLGGSTEVDVNPVNVYGASKLAGDFASLAAGGCVIRTNYVAFSKVTDRPSFVDWIVSSALSKQPPTFFEDIFFNPVHAEDLAIAIGQIISGCKNDVYNIGAVDGISKYEFAVNLLDKIGVLRQAMFRKGRVRDCANLAKRPSNMTMSVEYSQKSLGLRLPTIDDVIKRLSIDYNFGEDQ